MSEWISVEERLPEPGGKDSKVLVYIPESKNRQHGCFLANLAPIKADDGSGNFWGLPTPGSKWTVWGFSYFEEPNITHWMPLPEPPTSE